MTTILNTFVERTEFNDKKNVHRVFYQIDYGQSTTATRCMVIDASSATEDSYKLAELLAIKYLLLHSPYLGEGRTGKNMKLVCSNGAIKKVQKQQVANSDLIKHGKFLQIRFSEAQIATGRKFGWVDTFKGTPEVVSEIQISDSVVKTAAGELVLTHHSVERFMQRMNIATLGSAWKELVKVLTSLEWKLAKEKTIKVKGDKRSSETWSLANSQKRLLNVVIVRGETSNQLVTVIC